jgi:hypothetical protein
MNLNMPQFTRKIQQTISLLQIRNADWPLLTMATDFCPPLHSHRNQHSWPHSTTRHNPHVHAHSSHNESEQNISGLTDRRRGRAVLFVRAVRAVSVSITASQSRDTACKVTYELALSTLCECTHTSSESIP